MNPDLHWLVVAIERKLLSTQIERAERIAEARATPGRSAPGPDRRAWRAAGRVPVGLDARDRGISRREAALDASAAR